MTITSFVFSIICFDLYENMFILFIASGTTTNKSCLQTVEIAQKLMHKNTQVQLTLRVNAF